MIVRPYPASQRGVRWDPFHTADCNRQRPHQASKASEHTGRLTTSTAHGSLSVCVSSWRYLKQALVAHEVHNTLDAGQHLLILLRRLNSRLQPAGAASLLSDTPESPAGLEQKCIARQQSLKQYFIEVPELSAQQVVTTIQEPGR